MNLSAPFVRRPIGTLLLTIGVALTGIAAFFGLPVAPLPQVDLPTVNVQATLSGASPETMASSVAAPLEKRLGNIAGVTEMTSQSGIGTTRVTLQFDLSRDINGAARDVQAAINAARVDLPVTLTANPTYAKANPADAPIMIVALTSTTRTPSEIYDAVSTIVEQQLLQVEGVGQVELGGSALPGVRVDINPLQLARYGIQLEDVRTALSSASANRPRGLIEGSAMAWQIYSDAPGLHAAAYRDLPIGWRNGAAVRLSDVARVYDGPEDVRTMGLFNGKRAVMIVLTRQPGANIVATVDAVKARLPLLAREIPSDIHLQVASDRTTTIRASLREVEITLVIATLLVVAVVSLFLRSLRATIVPALAVIVSLLGTLGVMYLAGFSLDNLSLMALTVATGFVVDDAIVVLENISHHVEAGMRPREAALLGAREVGFTVLSISISLIAVFIPLLFMGGIIGRLFREFAVTMSVAVMISLVISLTTTPMLASLILRDRTLPGNGKTNRFSDMAERCFDKVQRGYARGLDWSLANRGAVLILLGGTVALNIFLLATVSKGFFPEQDTGSLNGGIRADQSISFVAMQAKLARIVAIIRHDPAVATVVAFTGGSRAGGGFLFATLKPRNERPSSRAIITRLRPKLAQISGVSAFLNPVQDLQIGGRASNSAYQYTLKADNAATLASAGKKLLALLRHEPSLTDLDIDVQNGGAETYVAVDRDSASRLGVTSQAVDSALYDSFGQRQVANIYAGLNQYHVVEGVDPRFTGSPTLLDQVSVPGTAPTTSTTTSSTATSSMPTSPTGTSTTGTSNSTTIAATTTMAGLTPSTTNVVLPPAAPISTPAAPNGVGSTPVTATSTANIAATASVLAQNQPGSTPASVTGMNDAATGSPVSLAPTLSVRLAAIAHWLNGSTPAQVNHQDGEPSATISFNLANGHSLGEASDRILAVEAAAGLPASVHGSFAGTALVFQQSISTVPLLVLAALIVIYIVLGVLYESAIHPLTVLSTLPSAGIGAVAALMIGGAQFDMIGLIGIILLIGIVKKNAIMIIDYALDAERTRGLTPVEAIREASLRRFRPILMTTFAAALGAVPLAIGFGDGAELRRPLGIAIVGGLAASQFLTLFTTPIVFLALDRLRRPGGRNRPADVVANGQGPMPA